MAQGGQAPASSDAAPQPPPGITGMALGWFLLFWEGALAAQESGKPSSSLCWAQEIQGSGE